MTLRYSHLAPSTLRDAVAVLEPIAEAVGHSAVNATVPRLPSTGEATTDFRSTEPRIKTATVGVAA